MAKDYTRLAEQLLRAVGGKNNITNAVHCATRLRFTLKDDQKADAKTAKKIPGVITVVEKAGQFQVVIGNTVPEVYKAVVRSGGLENMAASNENKGGNLLNRLIDTITGIFPPLLGIMCGGGLIKGLVAICNAAGWLTPDTGTYIVLNAVGDSVFYFLPVLLGFAAGRKFGGNPFLTAIIGASLIYPTILEMAGGLGGGTITFLKIPMVLINYSSSVIPILIAAYVCCKLENFINQKMPTAIKNFVTPMFCLLITVPLTLFVIGPVSMFIANGLAGGYQSLNPILGGMVIGAGWQVLVIFGMHWGFIPVMINNVTTLGMDTLGPAAQSAAMSQTGAAFGMALRMKNKAARGIAVSTVISGVFGITEPIVYGVTLPRKKPFVMGAIGGAAGGAAAGAIGAKSYSMGALGILSLPTTISPEGVGRGFWGALAGMVVAFVVAAVLNFLTYTDDAVPPKAAPSGNGGPDRELTSLSHRKTLVVYSPMNGMALPLSQSKDPVHACKALGKGVLIVPKDGKVCAPFDGEVNIVFDSKHALGLTSNDGLELLIHVGIDTVKLGGKYFTAHVHQGEKISKGQLLLEFDPEGIRKEGYELETPIIISNTSAYEQIIQVSKNAVRSGDRLLDVQRDVIVTA